MSQVSLGWFREGLDKRLGMGDKIRFWEDNWVGSRPFKEEYPRLYKLSEQ